ncbi:hypothetical protein SESBI_11141 [Sesbania bispinosa]|nr:hypothetical protein SESBI_11141 [Sesbania bispinosa]
MPETHHGFDHGYTSTRAHHHGRARGHNCRKPLQLANRLSRQKTSITHGSGLRLRYTFILACQIVARILSDLSIGVPAGTPPSSVFSPP